jgi:protein-S-isoprenylcysteine O-methyltransferase Ste14
LRGGASLPADRISKMETALRYILPVYLAIYVVTAFFWRSYVVWKKTGINPFVLGKSDSAHDFIGKVFGLALALSAAAVILYSSLPRLYQYLMPIGWLEYPAIKLAGLVLLLLSLSLTLIAQAQMGDSWRIGIDRNHKTTIVQDGVFRLSRNPIFLGMMTTISGLFLVIPNALTFAVLLLGTVVIQIQVRLEEEYLKELHGEQYLKYSQRVRRWL